MLFKYFETHPSQNPVYKVSPRSGVIEAQEKVELELSVLLNDSLRFSDTLSVLVQVLPKNFPSNPN